MSTSSFMLTRTAFEELLGLQAPWRVKEVVLDRARQEVTVRVDCGDQLWANEGGALHIHSWQVRRWRHLDLWQCVTVIEARVPRVKDPRTKKVETVRVPWAGGLTRWTKMFENHAIDVLLATRSISDAGSLLRLGWDACDNIMKRAVARGMELRPLQNLRTVGVDEKSFRRGQDYISLMTDLEGHRVLEVVEGGNKEAVVNLWNKLDEKELAGVEAAAMDRGKSMIAGTVEAAPHVEIVHDKFHIAQEQSNAVDAVRKEENKKLLQAGDDTLVGTKYQWLKGLEKLSDEAFASFNHLVKLNLKTARAWELKEIFEGFWRQPDAVSAQAYFKRWHARAVRSRLPAFVALAKSLAKSLPRLLTWFKHRINNAMTEGFNSVIQLLKSNARGFGSFEGYRARILFFCGGLDLKFSI